SVLVRGSLVHLLTVDEHHQIGVLLDGAGLAKIRQLWALILTGTLLRRARELRKCYNGNSELARQRLERTGDVADLLLSALRVRWTLHQLEIVYNHHSDVVLHFEPPRFRPHLEQSHSRRIIDPDRRVAENSRCAAEANELVIVKLAFAQPLRVN